MVRQGVSTAFLGLLLLLSNAPLAAQNAGPVLLRGQIVDANTLMPVAGAFVAPVESKQGVLTDSLGLFAMRVYRADEYKLRVAQLGYHDLEMSVAASSAEKPFRFMLMPDPIQLQGLTVLADRLADRRRGIYGIATVLDEKELLKGTYTSFYEMTQRLIPSAAKCPPTINGGTAETPMQGDQLCFNHQGHTQPVDVCIDGHKALGQGTELDILDPRGYYMVEAFPRVGQIRVYSRGYVARLAANGETLPPLSFGCSGAMPGGPG
jgi:hypothetical protein